MPFGFGKKKDDKKKDRDGFWSEQDKDKKPDKDTSYDADSETDRKPSTSSKDKK